jgi:hypothetical protein
MNAIAARMDFEQSVKIFDRAFNPTGNPKNNVVDLFRMTQSDLRLEQPFTTTNNLLTFPVLNNIQNQQGGQFNTEIRLAQQDSFVPNRIGIFFGLPTSSTDTSFKLYPYPSPFVFTNAAAMEAFYSGTMLWTMNNDKLLKNWLVMRHRKTNQTQQTALYGAGSPLDQMDMDEDGFVPMQPYCLILGSQDIQIQISLPLAPTAVDANTRIVMLLRGVIAQNSTVVN